MDCQSFLGILMRLCRQAARRDLAELIQCRIGEIRLKQMCGAPAGDKKARSRLTVRLAADRHRLSSKHRLLALPARRPA